MLTLGLTPFINLVLGLLGLNSHPALKRRFSALALIVFLVFIEAFLFGLENYEHWLFLIVILLVVAFFDFVFPLITQRKGSYIEKLEAQDKIDLQVTDIASLTSRYLGREYLTILLILFLGSLLARSAGEAEAVRQKEFLVTNSDPPLVILRIYSDNAIASTFNETTFTVNNEFSIINLSTSPNLIMKLREIGPLHSETPTPIASPTPPSITATPDTGTP